jgi:hypothetical protein
MYLNKFKHGFPFLDSREPDNLVGSPVIRLACEFEKIYRADMGDEELKKCHLTNLMYVRLLDEYGNLGLFLPFRC